MQLTHRDARTLATASKKVEHALHTYPALKNIFNEYTAGKDRIDYHLKPSARALGLNAASFAQQLRGAFYGAEAIREQRGRHEIKVMVRLPRDQRRSELDLHRFLIHTPQGGDVPLGMVAFAERNQSPTTIRREDGQRKVTISADLVEGARTAEDILTDLKQPGGLFEQLRNEVPGLDVSLVGIQREQQEAFASLGRNFILALFVIFALLAIPFRSYSQPLIIMFAIPFGFVGAAGGHWLMGYTLSFMSVMGIIALSGVVVNDSLVLIDAVNNLRKDGRPATDAVIEAGVQRMRPILLTSLTTFFGLAPMILETSVQAQFLIPMAISLGFGVLFVTFVVLLVVPCLYVMVEDGLRVLRNRLPPTA